MKHRAASITACLALSAMVLPAHAHTGVGVANGYWNGLLHPLLGADHLLVMLGVGFWGAILGGALRWLLPALFLSMMAAGAGIGFTDVSIQTAEMGVAFSVLALAVILPIDHRLPIGLVAVLVVVFAISHGYVHAREIESGMAVIPYALGFLMSTALLLVIGTASGFLSPSAIRLVRALYAVICAIAGAAAMAGV